MTDVTAALHVTAMEEVPYLSATVHHYQPCPACERDTLAIVVARVLIDEEQRVAGGWAQCLACNATPHPTMEVIGGR